MSIDWAKEKDYQDEGSSNRRCGLDERTCGLVNDSRISEMPTVRSHCWHEFVLVDSGPRTKKSEALTAAR